MRRFSILVSFLACFVFSPHASGQPAQSSSESEQKKLEIEQGKLALDRERFAFDQKKYESDHSLENWKTLAAVLSLLVPLVGAVGVYYFQVQTRNKDEALAFQLKAAEIIMAARDTTQAKGKAGALVKLFSGRLDNIQQALKE